ncbi:hypothetical protein MCGE09_00422 [Thaumarchaeota archaeon SCGC AB-539-E09]|nr:hypothetical protein MCGE09_00422 [Thaumarchaeota archaeon SCGC AB-539-E09]
MGKIVTIYLSDKEADELKKFCDENQCTQYSALKVTVKQILSEPMQREEVTISEDILDEHQEENIIEDIVEENTEEPEKDESKIEESNDLLRQLLISIRKERSRMTENFS